ncbi:hypothetical protein DFS33DRAFT_1387685 [Desarmillaria ectypa]|nr:hypothetical protein DFS33DRAFT_1387685 [Desarmillaria ectypa]
MEVLGVSLRCLTDTNDLSSDSQAAYVKGFFDQIPSLLKEQPGLVDSEKDELLHTIGLHKIILSPVRYLPAELLIEIFLYALDEHFDILQVTDGPYVLSHVCRSWRAVALACPELWTNFVLPWMNLHPRITGPVYLLDTVLIRSAQRPLSIIYTPEKANTATKFFYQYLLRECHRWKSARFNIPSDVYSSFIKAKNRLYQLECIDLILDIDRAEAENPTFFDAFASATRLRDVTISGTHIQETTKLTQTRLPWSQLRRFCTEHICSIDHLIQLMTNAPNLEVLEVLCVEWHYPRYAESLAIHDSLRSLRLWDPRLLDYLVLPALKCLDLDLDNGDLYASALEGFIQRSGCALKQLRIAGGNPKERVKTLLAANTITELTIDESFSGREYVETLFRVLTYKAKDNALLPHLERFTWIADISSFLFDGHCLVEMIESRRVTERVGSRLRFVKVTCRTWRSKFTDAVLDRLKKMKEEGLDVHVTLDDATVDKTWLPISA